MPELLRLSPLFSPRSVAVVGASKRAGSLGSEVLSNLLNAGFRDRLFAVNPKYPSIRGIPCYPRVEQLPGPIDCVILCIPAGQVPEMVHQAGEAGARAAIVFASGFAETGAEGQQLQRQLQQAAADYGMLICGPNCMGLVSLSDHFFGFSAPIDPASPSGRVAAVSQSGSVAIALLNNGRSLHFSHVVSSGNEAVLTLEDYLEYFVEDSGSDVILAFVEGFRNTPKLRQVAARAQALEKPIVVLKVGRSTTGQRVAVSHSGALAGSYAVHKGFFKQSGLIVAETIDEWLETARLLAEAPRPSGPYIGAVASSGGEAALIADIAEDLGLQFAKLSDTTAQALHQLLPTFSSIGNPLDAWGVGDVRATYENCLVAMGEDPSVDLVAVCDDLQAGAGEAQTAIYRQMAESMVNASRRIKKPLVVLSNLTGEFIPEVRQILADGRLPTLHGTRAGLCAVHHLIEYGTLTRRPPGMPAAVTGDQERGRSILTATAGRILTEHAGKQLLAAYQIRITREEVARTERQARELAAELGYPVVMKISSPDIQHKSDAGLVRLAVRTEQEVSESYTDILRRAQAAYPSAAIEGVLMQEWLDTRQALEVVVGLVTDPQFGPAVLVGMGGTLVEVLHDLSFRVVPLSRPDAESMLAELRLAQLLDGMRGKPPADRGALVDVILTLSQIGTDLGDAIAEIDINPLMVFPEGCGAVAADALLVKPATFEPHPAEPAAQ